MVYAFNQQVPAGVDRIDAEQTGRINGLDNDGVSRTRERVDVDVAIIDTGIQYGAPPDLSDDLQHHLAPTLT